MPKPRPEARSSDGPNEMRAQDAPDSRRVESTPDAQEAPTTEASDFPVSQAAQLWEHDPLIHRPNKTQRLSLQEVLVSIRKSHPLISEWTAEITDEESNALLDVLAGFNEEELVNYAEQLSPRDIGVVLHCFTVPLYPEEISLLESILRRRASWYVYRLAWSFLQQNYPNASLARCLETIYQELISAPWAHPRPHDLERVLLDEVPVAVDDAVFIKACLEFLSQEMRQDPQFSFDAFIERYQLEIGSNFFVNFMGDFFLAADPSWYVTEQELFAEVLSRLHPSSAANLVLRSLDADLPEAAKQSLLRLIGRLLIQEQTGSGVWDFLDPQIGENFKRWYLNDRLRQHTVGSVAKRRVYFTFIDAIEDLAQLTPNLLALRFHDFIVVDDRRDPDKAFYYDDATVEKLLRGGLKESALATPPMLGRSPADALAMKRKEGLVELRFNRAGVPDTMSYLKFVLGTAHRPPETQDNSRLKLWFL